MRAVVQRVREADVTVEGSVTGAIELSLIHILVIAVIIVAVSSINIYREEVLEIDPDVKMEEQNTLSFASAYIDTLNPIVSKSEDTYYISKLIYNSLFDYTADLNVEGEMVESYTVDTEKAYVDITLRSGVTFHNGDSLTARDISFTVNAIKSYGSEGIYYEKASKIDSVNVKDDRNVRIYFSDNYDCSLDALTFPILPRGEYSSAGALLKDTDEFVPVGTGMYKYSSYDSLKELDLSPNESYFADNAQKSVSIKILPEKTMASNMLEIGSVTCYTDIGSDRKSLVEDKGLTLSLIHISSDNGDIGLCIYSGHRYGHRRLHRHYPGSLVDHVHVCSMRGAVRHQSYGDIRNNNPYSC